MAITSMADELMIFPSADQSAEQKEQDKCACYSWVKGESGFDPMAPPTASEPSTPEQWEQEQVSIWAGNLNRFDHAYAASLERKDYTVR